jgi:hypothetical protein
MLASLSYTWTSTVPGPYVWRISLPVHNEVMLRLFGEF